MVLMIAGLASSPTSVIKCTIIAITEVLRANKSRTFFVMNILTDTNNVISIITDTNNVI